MLQLVSVVIGLLVAGFLPFRSDFSLTQNLPKPDIITSSPASNRSFIISRIPFTVSTA
jgi:hypothetical protein